MHGPMHWPDGSAGVSGGRVEIRAVRAARGADWIREGYALFRAEPLTWILLGLVWLLALVASQTLGTALKLLLTLALPVLTGGLLIGCATQSQGEPLRLQTLWAASSRGCLGALLMLGVYSLIGVLLAALAGLLVVGASIGGVLLSGGGLESMQIGASAVITLLVIIVALLPISMALWFAPVLVALHGQKPLASLGLSFRACWRNPGALSLQGLLLILIAIAATIPLGLGWLVATPVIIASIYVSSQDLFAAAASHPDSRS